MASPSLVSVCFARFIIAEVSINYIKESGKGASSGQVKSLQEAAASIGRKLGINDASIVGGAINNNVSVLTNDKRMINFMNALGLPVKSF